jgi:hypothetical protein
MRSARRPLAVLVILGCGSQLQAQVVIGPDPLDGVALWSAIASRLAG